MHGVKPTTPFDPPEAAAVILGIEAAKARDAGDVLQSKGRGRELDRLPDVLAVEVERVAQQFAIFGAGGHLLVKFRLRFSPHAEGRARQKAYDPVAGCIDKQRRPEGVAGRVLAAKGGDGLDGVNLAAAPLAHFVDCGVKQQVDVWFFHHLLQQDRVEDNRVALRVAKGVLDQNLVDHAALARPAVVVAHVCGGPQDPQPHFTRRVAAEDGPILHQRHAQPLPRRCNGAAGACHAATHDHQVIDARFRF